MSFGQIERTSKTVRGAEQEGHGSQGSENDAARLGLVGQTVDDQTRRVVLFGKWTVSL